MRTRVKVTEKDLGWNKLYKLTQKLKGGKIYAKAGVLSNGNARNDGPIDNVTLAMIQEFGTDRIPARSFVRAPFADNRLKYEGILKKVLTKVYGGDIPALMPGLNAIGLAMATDMKKRITTGAGIPPPNAPSTIAAKGSSRPLVDTGQLVGSITHAVVEEK